MEKIETNVIKPDLSFMESGERYEILSISEEGQLESKVKEIESYMSSTTGKGKSEQEKDAIYRQSQMIWHNFVGQLKEAKFQFHLNRAQYEFLTTLILTKLEYDVNTVFFAIELTDTLAQMKDAKFQNDTELISFPMNATEITYIYHLIQTHKVKGLTKSAYTFSKILIRIGAISKIFNYYETLSKNLSKDIQDWVLTFEDGIEMDSASKPEVLEPKED